VSAGSRVNLVRTNAAGAEGDLAVGAGARLSGGSISLEGSRGILLAEQALLEAVRVDLAATRVNLGEVPAGGVGTTLGLDTVERLGSASDLLIRGHESITLF